ncbi:NAD(P)H-binding protein [Auraticoccus sp. F435]|uniref:NAD(P)H-binding protein n=1 Tax=Auraticoccus cholistanensis TaxID=2656650 RepID=A0A6A9UVL6_9ACTN|nr:NAD(P)H-binding protein [Auraticoccus cholistanensis]MVA76883.1 NAD(P)H-binding protein [Auraticoccus cholistanensis]
MQVAITAPTGHVGSELVRALVQGGVRPRVLVRDPARLPSGLAGLVDVAVVDLTDAAGVVAATAGVDSLFWLQPDTGAEDPVEQHRVLARIAARAVTEHRIQRVVLVSSVGAEARGGFGDIDGLAAAEQVLADAAPSLCVLRCGYFFTNLLTAVDDLRAGRLATTFPLDLALAWVHPRDVAEVAALRLVSPGWHGLVHQAVHGPQDLDHRQVAALLSRVLRRPVEAVQLEEEQVAAELRSFGMGEARVQALLGMSRGFAHGFTPEQPRSLLSTTPSTLAAWAQEVLLPVL